MVAWVGTQTRACPELSVRGNQRSRGHYVHTVLRNVLHVAISRRLGRLICSGPRCNFVREREREREDNVCGMGY
jgi:hypothetical protein